LRMDSDSRTGLSEVCIRSDDEAVIRARPANQV